MKLTFLDSSGGAIMTFQCQLMSDTMVLLYNKTTLHCSKVTTDNSSRPFGHMTYTLLSALEEGFFADMTIRAADDSKVCHSVQIVLCVVWCHRYHIDAQKIHVGKCRCGLEPHPFTPLKVID
jgi:hypothetical protein